MASVRELRGAGGDDDMCDYLAAEVDAVDREADEAPAAPVAASPIKRDPAQMVDETSSRTIGRELWTWCGRLATT